jgi:hypothetical protein
MKHDDELVKLIYESWEKDRAERGGDLREHLGASVIGRECDREIWYGFRWFKDNLFDGRMLRLFDRGRREEPVVLVDLMAAGLKFDYSTEEQPSFSDHGGTSEGRRTPSASSAARSSSSRSRRPATSRGTIFIGRE